MTNAAAIYVRISEDREGAGLGVQRQEQDCRALAARLGWDVATVYTDNDVSAYSGKPRPSYGRLLEDLRDRKIDAVLAWHPDRLHRSPRELEGFIDVCESRAVAVQTVKAGNVDLGTPSGRAVARTLGAWARFESEHKSERIRRKARELAEAGKLGGGGTRPFGFDDDRITLREGEAALVREATARIFAGESVRHLCVDWKARGITTPTGGAWTQTPLRRMLMGGRIAGWREHHGQDVAPAEWPPIITDLEHQRIRTLLGDPARSTGGTPRRYLLAGMLRCGLCGRTLVSRPRGDHVRRYVCASGPSFGGCGKVAIVAEPLEEFVTEATLIALDGPELARALDLAAEENHAGEAEQLRADEASLEQLARDFYVDRIIGRGEYLAAKPVLDARVEAGRREMGRHGRPGANLADVIGGARRTWPDLSFDRRRALLSLIVAKVTIGAGRRGLNHFDRTRVEISWLA